LTKKKRHVAEDEYIITKPAFQKRVKEREEILEEFYFCLAKQDPLSKCSSI